MKTETLHPDYVTDSEGHKKAVILPIEEFNELLEDLDDLACVAERRDELTVAHGEGGETPKGGWVSVGLN